MIKTRSENVEVLYPVDDVVLLEEADLAEMKRLSLLNPRKRVRLCAHRASSEILHEMFIIHTNETYVRPHKHIDKAESFAILEGEVDVVLFQENGTIRQVIPMGPPASGKKFYYRVADPIYHSLLIRTKFLVFHEVTSGPFLREQTVFAPWEPEGDEVDKVRALDAQAKVFVAQQNLDPISKI
jgi:cupin fold WbuC family metalloprotein